MPELESELGPLTPGGILRNSPLVESQMESLHTQVDP